MKTEIISKIWANRKPIAEIATTTFVIGKGIADFIRKDGIGKVLAIAELGLGLGAAAINTGIADKAISTIAESKAAAIHTGFADDYDEDEDYDPEDDAAYEESPEEEDVDEDGFNTSEFDEFINSGESPEYDDENEETDPEEE